MKVLAMDLGGTYCRLGSFDVNSSDIQILDVAEFHTAKFQNFEEVLKEIEREFSLQPENADLSVFALAGPISADGLGCNPPNIPWNIDLKPSMSRFGGKGAILINDFLAQAWFCVRFIGDVRNIAGVSNQDGIVPVLSGQPRSSAASVVLGAGTGLGTAFIVRDRQGHLLACPAEGGHGNFAASTKDDFKLQNFVCEQLKTEDVIWEHLVSGPGLALIHKYLTGKTLTPNQIASDFSSHQDTLEWFARLYGRVVRNYTLSILALGGVYIAAGVAAKNPEIVKHPAFEEGFRGSREYRELLTQVPVWLVDHPESGLWGCAYCAQSLLCA